MATKTSLHRNAFNVIGASTRDGRARIIELADEAALFHDATVSHAAGASLINPRMRLAAEMAWLPGLAPERIAAILEKLVIPPGDEVRITGLARANLIAGRIESLDDEPTASEAKALILDLTRAVESIEPVEVLRAVNDDRKISGFPAVVEGELFDRTYWSQRASYRGVITTLLDRIPTGMLVEIVGAVVREATNDGSRPAPGLIQDLAKTYDLSLTDFLQAAFRNVSVLTGRVRRLAPYGNSIVKPVIAELQGVIHDFSTVAYPILAASAVSGLHHPVLSRIVDQVIPLGRHLYGEFDYDDLASDLFRSLADAVPSADPLRSMVAEELKQLADLRDGERRQLERGRWQTYHVSIGPFAGDRVELTSDGISWSEGHIPFDGVTRLRWSGTTQALTRFPVAPNFAILIGNGEASVQIQPKNAQIYGEVIDRLWYAVGRRLMIDIVRALKAGASLPFGSVTIWDDRVVVRRPKLAWQEPQRAELPWRDTRIWTQSGAFHIGSSDKTLDGAIRYGDHDNIVIVEHAIRMFFKAGNERISIILRSLG